jgi:hypothetical protein
MHAPNNPELPSARRKGGKVRLGEQLFRSTHELTGQVTKKSLATFVYAHSARPAPCGA